MGFTSKDTQQAIIIFSMSPSVEDKSNILFIQLALN